MLLLTQNVTNQDDCELMLMKKLQKDSQNTRKAEVLNSLIINITAKANDNLVILPH